MDNLTSFTNDLVRASEMLLAAPDVVTVDQRREAEHVFLSFHKMSNPYSVCKHVLENCNNQYTVYHAVHTVQEALMREWTSLKRSDIKSLQAYLIQYVINKSDIQSYVRERVVQTVAIVHKRFSLDCDDSDIDKNSLFADIAQLFLSGSQQSQLLACSILSALLNEYSGSARTSAIGLTWEQHNKCKTTFEQHDMKQVLAFCVQTMLELHNGCVGTSIDQKMAALLGRLLTVIEQVLSWEFTSRCHRRKHVGSFNGCQAVSFKPPSSWRDLVLDKAFIGAIFKSYRSIQSIQELSHQTLLCIGQLASINGNVFPTADLQIDFLNHFVQLFLDVFASCPLRAADALDIANIVYNILTHSSLPVIEKLSSDILLSFLAFLSKTTCEFCRAAAVETGDDTVYSEAFDRMLESWMKFVDKYNDLPSDALKQHAADLFNTYLHCHLAPPDGSRNQAEDEEYDEMGEDDRDKYLYQLVSIGSFARLIPDYSLPLLSMLLTERIHRLEGARRVLQSNSSSTHQTSAGQPALESINEDIHWLLLVSANALADSSDGGEIPMIPLSLVRSSQSTLTGAMLSQVRERFTGAAAVDSQTSVEPVTSLVLVLFRLCQARRDFVDCGLSSWLSPEVGQSLSYLLTRWSYSYLFPDLSCYSSFSSSAGVVLGQATVDSLCWAVQFLIEQITMDLVLFSGESELTTQSLNLLLSLVERKERCDVAVQCSALWKLAQDFTTGNQQLHMLSPSCRRLLYRALVLASSAEFSNGSKDSYIQIVFKSIHDGMKAITSRPDLRSVYHDESVKSSVLNIIDCMCSIADASRSDNISQIFSFLYPMAVDLVSLFDLYHNYDEVVQAVVQFFNVVVKQVTCSLNDKECSALFEVILSMMHIFAKHNVGRKNVSKDSEEEQFAVLLTLMDLMSNLLSKDFLDFATDENENGGTTSLVCAADVVLYGLNIIAPLMTAELLKFPSLCTAYMSLLAYLAEIHAARLCQLPDDLFHHLMGAVDHGLTSSAGSDIVKASLELISSMFSHVFTDQQLRGKPAYLVGAHFLEVMLNMLLADSFDMDLMEISCSAFYALICCHQTVYQDLVNKLLTAHSGSPYYEQLLNAFNGLTGPGQQLNIDRVNRVRFLQNFDQFLVSVRSILCIR